MVWMAQYICADARGGGALCPLVAPAAYAPPLAMGVVEPHDESLSRRELRNESGRVLRAANEGALSSESKTGCPQCGVVCSDTPQSTSTEWSASHMVDVGVMRAVNPARGPRPSRGG